MIVKVKDIRPDEPIKHSDSDLGCLLKSLGYDLRTIGRWRGYEFQSDREDWDVYGNLVITKKYSGLKGILGIRYGIATIKFAEEMQLFSFGYHDEVIEIAEYLKKNFCGKDNPVAVYMKSDITLKDIRISGLCGI